MNLLAFDTATPATAVAVRTSGGHAAEARHEPEPDARPGHVEQVLPLAARLLADAGLRFSDLDRIGVGLGPGTFTGLRIGIATARAIAAAWTLPVHGVSSLAALATGAGDAQADPVLAVIDARRGEAFAALHAGAEERWPPFVAGPEELGERLRAASRGVLAVGDGAVRFRAELESAGARVPADDDPRHVVRALHVCRLAARVAPAAPEAILPEYLRMPDAVPSLSRISP